MCSVWHEVHCVNYLVCGVVCLVEGGVSGLLCEVSICYHV